MSDAIFRLVIAAAVVLACIAFVVQAAVAIAFYRSVRKIQEKVDSLSDTVEPLIGKMEPVIGKLGPIIDKAAPVVERLGPMMDGATQTMERMKPVIDRLNLLDGCGGLVEHRTQAFHHRRGPIEDRPQFSNHRSIVCTVDATVAANSVIFPCNLFTVR